MSTTATAKARVVDIGEIREREISILDSFQRTLDSSEKKGESINRNIGIYQVLEPRPLPKVIKWTRGCE